MAEMLEAEHNELAEAWLMDGRDYESKFHQILNKLMKLGWDKEYMGIA